MKKHYSLNNFFLLLIILLTSCSSIDNKEADIDSLLKTLGETWSTHDVDKMVSLFTEDCTYEDIFYGKIYEGKEGVATYAKQTFSEIPDFQTEIVSINFSDNWAMMEWIMKGSSPLKDSISGEPQYVNTFAVKGASIIELKEGKIFKIRDYYGY